MYGKHLTVRSCRTILLLIPICTGCTSVSRHDSMPSISFAIPDRIADSPMTAVQTPCCAHPPQSVVPARACHCQPTQHSTRFPIENAVAPAVTASHTSPQRSNVSETAGKVVPTAAQLQIPPVITGTARPDGLRAVPPCGENAFVSTSMLTQQIDALTKRMLSMETALRQSNESIASLNTALTKANQDVSELTSSVEFWRGEVKRLEASMKLQHESDIESLTKISQMLDVLNEETDRGDLKEEEK